MTKAAEAKGLWRHVAPGFTRSPSKPHILKFRDLHSFALVWSSNRCKAGGELSGAGGGRWLRNYRGGAEQGLAIGS